jgi:phage terminase large subunit-like protein
VNVLDDIADLITEAETVPTLSFCPIPWQLLFFRDMSPFRLLRCANQLGKTSAVVVEIVDLIRGTGHKPRPWNGPINITLISESIEQMAQEGAILEKLWDMLPKGEIDPRVGYQRGRGLVGVKYPAITFTSGPGAGSVIRLRTYNQGPEAVAGSTIHAVYCDEPCSESVYSELAPRLLKHGGWFTISFTPVPNMPDQGWLRKLVERGVFSEHHVTMKPEHTQPLGWAKPLLSQDKIDAFRKALPAGHAEMRCNAAWEVVTTTPMVSEYDDARHAREFALGDIVAACAQLALPPARLVVSIDHGLVPGKQRAALIAVAAHPEPERRSSTCRIWHIDEVALPDITTPADDARNIKAMLERHGLDYSDIDEWVGDRSTGQGRDQCGKDNAQLRVQLLASYRISSNDKRAKRIHWPKKGTGSVYTGAHLMNTLYAENRALVHPRCKEFRAALLRFKGDTRDPYKDVWDAHRYGIEHELKSTFVGTPGRASRA